MKRLVAIASVAVMLLTPAPSFAQPGGIAVVLDPTSASFELGGSAKISVSVTNNTDQVLEGMVVHIDITDPDNPGSVDPEDWTQTLTKPLGVVQPGQGATIDWSIQPISGGRFTIYAVVLESGSSDVHASAGSIFDVVERRTLNPKGVLPVALAMPAAIALTLVGRRRFRRQGSEANISA